MTPPAALPEPRSLAVDPLPPMGSGPRAARTLAQTAAALRGSLWAPADALAAAGAVLLGHRLSPVFLGDPTGPDALRVATVHAGSFLLAAYAAGLYDWSVLARRSRLVLRAFLAALLSLGLTLAVFYLVFYRPIGRWVMAYAVMGSALGSLLPRVLVQRLLWSRPRRILFVGDDSLAERMVDALARRGEPLYAVVGRWRDGQFHELGRAPAPAVPAGDLALLCRTHDVDEVVLPTRAAELETVLRPALHCLPLGCRVRVGADLYEEVFQSLPVADVTPEWMLNRGWDTSNHLVEALKRGSDVVLALAILVLSAPVVALAMLLVALGGDGPVFYSQLRVGRYGRPFRIWKLRTMRVDAEQGQARWAQDDDPRRTLVGRALRRTRIDELPQLVNVLLGDMSFVGPRPERPEFVAQLQEAIPYYAWRHLVRPGLTGWAQINYPYGASVDDARRKLEYDLYYVRHTSLVTDLAIVLRTATAAMGGAR